MFKKLLFSVLSLVLVTIFFSCGNETIKVDPANLEFEFYPIDEISTWEYRMDSVIYDSDGLIVDTTVSFLQEKIRGFNINNEGDTVYNIEIYRKQLPTDEYSLTDIWTASRRNNSFQRTEENLGFIKLVFPPVLGKLWDGNQFPENIDVIIAGDAVKMYKNWQYEYDDRLENLTVAGTDYTDVLKVFQANNTNVIERRFSVEYYAKNVGLIKRELEIFDTQCVAPECEDLEWVEKAHQGFKLNQVLIDFY